ncbi:MAG: hypothetical protein CMM91_11585 [Rickettsiales bacterium]|jgi:hypothetical protein|nr:hypothetical protein [Rickettsiales bacterium]MAI85548.1 hypothetical protein [Rickettsiales bacterium]|tara:strand:+ start:1716 stop:2321 length:606 start_codon:yes stop_codon:yes gene_type:complete
MLLGIVGLIGSGKDTVAQRLVEKHGFQRDSFAKSLKDAVASMFNWDREMLEGNTSSSRHWREQPDKFWSERFGKSVTPRWVLQYFGTEVMRGKMYDAIWIDSCLGRYRGQNTVISDTRFVNEIKTIKAHGGKIICVKRGDLPSQKEMQERGAHRSEWDWLNSDFDFIIDNYGTKDELFQKVDELVISLEVTHSPAESLHTG